MNSRNRLEVRAEDRHKSSRAATTGVGRGPVLQRECGLGRHNHPDREVNVPEKQCVVSSSKAMRAYVDVKGQQKPCTATERFDLRLF